MHETLVHIVDDEEEICRSTAFFLRASGIPCRSWSSGDSFLEGADLHAPGCVILDLRMPGKDGIAVQKALAERGSGLRVIMVSGHGDWTVAQKVMESGALDFIEKPYDEKLLVARLEEVLGRSA
jgi:two-component system response regulator FixJ